MYTKPIYVLVQSVLVWWFLLLVLFFISNIVYEILIKATLFKGEIIMCALCVPGSIIQGWFEAIRISGKPVDSEVA
jgi:hypothetical protein